MSKEITKAYILQQIQDKFAMRDLIPEKFTFEESVIPVYDVSQHLSVWSVKSKILSITSATSYIAFTVPATQRWTIRAYTMIFMTGVYTISGAFMQRAGPTDAIYLDLVAGQSVSYTNETANYVILDPGDTLNILVDGYTSPGNFKMNIDVKMENIR